MYREAVTLLTANNAHTKVTRAALVAGLIFALAFAAFGQTEEPEIVLKSDTDYQKVSSLINADEMRDTVEWMAKQGSRVTGYPGCENAAKYVEQKFRDLDLGEITTEEFPVLVPSVVPDALGRAASLDIPGDRSFEILPLWPNLVRMPKTPPEGISGKLIYAGNGDLRAFTRLEVSNSIVLVDFNSGAAWFNAPLLGAKAVLFIEPEETLRGEAEQKFLSIPVDIPRYWVPKESADYLQGMLKLRGNVPINIKCNMQWKQVIGKNIVCRVKGTDSRLSKQQVVLQAYYDSMSIAPTLSPGAENACSIAALLQIAKTLKAQPPKRTVLLLATAGHFEGMKGEKSFVRQRIRGARSERRVRQLFDVTDLARRDIEDAADRVWEEQKTTAKIKNQPEKTDDEIADERMRALGRISKAIYGARKKMRTIRKVISITRSDDPNHGKLEERKLTDKELDQRKIFVDKFEAALPAIDKAIEDAQNVAKEARKVPRDADLQQKTAALDTVKKAVENLTDALDFSAEGLSAWFAVDLSSHNNVFGVFYKAYFYNYNESIQWKFSDIGKKSREYGDLIANSLSVSKDARMVDGINAIQGKNWQTYMAGKLALSNEVATLGGIPGIGFATVNDSRPWVDTPMDKPEYVQFGNLNDQAKFLSCLLADLISIGGPDKEGKVDPKDRKIYDLRLDDNFVEVKGRLVEFDPQVSTFPDEPVENAVAVARVGTKSCMGVRAEMFDLSTPYPPGTDLKALRKMPTKDREKIIKSAGRINMIGLPNVRATGAPVPVEGYLLDPKDGHVSMAPDMGINGAEAYPIALTLDQEIKPITCVMFSCKPMTIYDMVDQRFFQLLQTIDVYDATTDAAPYEFGYCLPLPPQQFVSYYEPVAVVFAPSGTKVKITMGASVLGNRFVLINPSAANKEGDGYLIDDYPSMYATPYRVAVDMWKLDETRINRLKAHGIENSRVNTAHARARADLTDAAKYLRSQEYDKFFTSARSAWSFECRAYPDVRTTENDVVKGILFYLFLLLPFAFFAERLLIASPDIRYQIVWSFVVFLGIFTLIALVHPAFAITFTPVIILLAFVILALTAIVIAIIVQKFEDQMKEVKYEQTGIKTADVGRLSASGAAFSLGIANLRRRKTRTLLTCLTLILLTFTVLSCTSVVESVRSNRIRLPKSAPYQGILIRDKTWAPIGEPTARVMQNEFGDRFPVAPRAWYMSSNPGEQSFVTVSRAGNAYAATALVGLTPEEDKITNPSRFLRQTEKGPKSRWFQPGDNLVCIIPDAMAQKLGVTPDDVGAAKVSVFGNQLRVIGIVDENKFKQAIDLDGEQITPVDYLLMQEQQAQQQSQSSGSKMSEDQLREYIHLAPSATIFVPYDYLISNNGTLRSVAIAMTDSKQVQTNLDNLMSRIELNIYAGIFAVTANGETEKQTFLCSAVGSTSFKGAQDLIIPILIAAAIVLNTMLGSVYERVKEIYIYSSLGLAPTHVAALFIAEACVYAVLGAIAGYLVGQVGAKVLLTTNMLHGLNLNYSSLSAVMTTLIIMFTTLISVIYPAKKASSMAMPGIERRWTLPEPENDQISMDLPFTVTGDQALGVNVFLREYLGAHADYSLGHFSTADITLGTKPGERGEGYELELMVWLAPYDLGVSERMYLQTVATEDEEVYQIHVVIARESGDEASWIRVTRNFINMLRKQYLLWRTFPAGLKGDYGQRGLKILAGEVDDVTAG
jgi:hypothetical protein